jgi:hypothetical protein
MRTKKIPAAERIVAKSRKSAPSFAETQADRAQLGQLKKKTMSSKKPVLREDSSPVQPRMLLRKVLSDLYNYLL